MNDKNRENKVVLQKMIDEEKLNRINDILIQNQQLKKINYILNEKIQMLGLIELLKNTEKKFIFMLTPIHGNLGDQAIVIGEYFVMQSCFPEYKIIEIPYHYMVGELGEIFSSLGYKKYIHPEDDIILHGGGNMGNLWLHEEIARRSVIENFPNNRIVSFPQSVYFTDDEDGKNEIAISTKIYNAHKNLHIMLRDENSFEIANKLFKNAKTYLVPDIVTSLFGTLDNVNVQRDGVLFVLRKDKEKILSDSAIQQIQEVLKQNNIPFSVIDTCINENVFGQNRQQKVYEMLLNFRKSRLVVTDRFHGVVFSVITRTPVAAFKSYDTKISSGIKWFKDFPSVYYAQNESLIDMLKFMENAYNGKFSEKSQPPPPQLFRMDSEKLCKKIFQKSLSTDDVDKFVKCLVPISHCNLHCDYCYVIQGNLRDAQMPNFRLSPAEIGRAFNPKRWNAKRLFVSFCGMGETLLCKEMTDIIYHTLAWGNFVNVTNNGTMTSAINKLINMPKDLSSRLVFAFSLHYKELKQKNLLKVFADNVKNVMKSESSFTVQLNLYDGYLDYLD